VSGVQVTGRMRAPQTGQAAALSAVMIRRRRQEAGRFVVPVAEPGKQPLMRPDVQLFTQTFCAAFAGFLALLM
jgi:hypothetical protein